MIIHNRIFTSLYFFCFFRLGYYFLAVFIKDHDVLHGAFKLLHVIGKFAYQRTHLRLVLSVFAAVGIEAQLHQALVHVGDAVLVLIEAVHGVDRAILAVKGINRKVKLTVSPKAVMLVRVDGKVKTEAQVSDAYGYIFCYLLIMFFFAAVNYAFGLDFITGVTASIACIGNVGPGFGDVGTMSNYAAFPGILKFTSLIEMLIGRLEIFPALYLLRSASSRL